MMEHASSQIGFLHPGQMGAALARIVKDNGHEAWWLADQRSPATAERAAAAGLKDAGSLAYLCQQCAIIVAICPPHGALEVAQGVAACGFSGLYLEANAISPATARQIAETIAGGGGTYVDAAVIGPPPGEGQASRLYLAGDKGAALAHCFAAPCLAVEWLGPHTERASALKMCHSALHKGRFALLLAALAAADHFGVEQELERCLSGPGAQRGGWHDPAETLRRSAKGWRFAGEMQEVAATMALAGLPAGLHQAAAEIFARLPRPSHEADGQKNQLALPDLLEALQKP